jgi:hypothetical protein
MWAYAMRWVAYEHSPALLVAVTTAVRWGRQLGWKEGPCADRGGWMVVALARVVS